MSDNQAASGRQARTVRILSHAPLLVQDKTTKVKRGKKIETIKVRNTTIIVWQSASGDLTIEIDPP